MKIQCSNPFQTGTGMVELLVSMLILLVGILGIAGLQTKGLANNKSSYSRTQVTVFAEDLFDRMRANRAVALTGSYDIADSSTIAAPSGACMTNSPCSATALATADVSDWFSVVKSTLPSAKVTLTRTNNNFVLVFMWDDNRKGSIGTSCGVDVTCMTFTTGL